MYVSSLVFVLTSPHSPPPTIPSFSLSLLNLRPPFPILSFIFQITSPRGGTLVLFDSVSLPHEVMTTLEGERLALAGWLHEKQQAFPSWFVG